MIDEQAHAAGDRIESPTAPSRADAFADGTLRQFVLGALDDRQRLEIEERLISDPAMADALKLAEGGLAEAYVDGELSPGDRQRFERHCLTSTERCRQVTALRLARDRARIGVRTPRQGTTAAVAARPVGRGSSGVPSAWTLAVAGFVCLTVAGSVGLIARLMSLQRQLAVVKQQHADVVSEMSIEIARLSAHAAELEGAAGALSARVAGGAARAGAGAAEYELRSGTLRDDGKIVRIVIPVGAPLVRFRVRVADAVFPAYRAVMVDAHGAERWSISALVPDTVDGVLVLRFVTPSELLVAGDYEVQVTGLAADGHQQPIAAYPFRRPS